MGLHYTSLEKRWFINHGSTLYFSLAAARAQASMRKNRFSVALIALTACLSSAVSLSRVRNFPRQKGLREMAYGLAKV